MMNKPDSRQHILEVAQHLIQLNGYNAFSYRDIADEVGIKTSSIHYYFPSKADLVAAVIADHRHCLDGILDNIQSNNAISYKTKLSQFIDAIFDATYYSQRKMCLGGMLASDVLTLPEPVLALVKQFFSHLEKWLATLLEEGKQANKFTFAANSKIIAQIIMNTIEGTLLFARLYHDDKRIELTKKQILNLIH